VNLWECWDLNSPAFRRALLAWYDREQRDLPWRRTTGFYPVWVSEIMLQQTRVEAVIPYYERFLARFPDIAALAAAPEDDVLALWSGLGYYSRARNLQRAAQQILAQGVPHTVEQILDLPGIGPYTAAAIASIVYQQPIAAIDGNVLRVISRLSNDAAEISAPRTRRRFAEMAQDLLDTRRPGDFNQAMMELGATVCAPKSPSCSACPVARLCAARAAGTVMQLPVKLRKAAIRDVTLDLALIIRNGRVLLQRRGASEKRLAGFWDLPLREVGTRMAKRPAAEFRHHIVNERFLIRVWKSHPPATPPEGSDWIEFASLDSVPLTTIARKAIRSAGAVTAVKEI
jgi:A/G-specific adenine glycosylase